jgi:hypothetical protein
MERRRIIASVFLSALAGCGGGGSSAPPLPAPIVALSASATDVAVNGAVKLTWSSTNASACAASGDWSGSLQSSGNQNVTVPRNATYTLNCTGAGGTGTGTVSVTAWAAPTSTITADSTAILANNTVALSWSSQNARSCAGGGALSGSLATSGTQQSTSLAQTTVFSLSCSNPVFAAASASVTVTVSTTFALALTVKYQAPGAPILDATQTGFVPDWSHPVASPVPFVWVELDNPGGGVVQTTYADVNGVARFTGLDPAIVYTPVIRAQAKSTAVGIDFWVVNNTRPIDTTQGSFRARYAPYANSGAAYTAGTRLVSQTSTLTAPDGWNDTTGTLVDAQRIAGPFELLSNAVLEAQIVDAAVGVASPSWPPLTILWSTTNKGGLSAPPENYDLGVVTGSGGFWTSGHGAIDAGGTATGAFVVENFIYVSGDPTFEAMEVYPFIMTHEMGHFTQSLFSTLATPAGNHAYSDYEDPTLAWIEGNASGIAALVMNTPKQLRVLKAGGAIFVDVEDIAANTVNGVAQSWPVGWYQETTTTGLMWKLYDPAGTTRLSAATVLAPMFSATWQQAPWLNSVWAYVTLLKQLNPGAAGAIDTLAQASNITSVGNDAWGSTETHTGNRTAHDVLPPYTRVAIGAPAVQVCSAGAPLDYNKAGNVRYLRIAGDGNLHTLSIQGQAGTVPLFAGIPGYTVPGSTMLTAPLTLPVGEAAMWVGDCAVSGGEFPTDTAFCSESAPPAEQCWSITWQ